MAMLISKFHRMIQSRILWLAFLVIVIFSFVIWGTVTPDARDARDAFSPGTLDGKPVDPAVFRQAYFNTYLSVVLALGRAIDISPLIDEQLRQAAWQRIATLRAAERMGISVSDDEVAAAIQQHEAFQFEGQFNVMAYKAFAQSFLARFSASERQFEEYVRQEIALQKVRQILDRATLVTPFELARAFRAVTDRFEAEYVVVPQSLVERDVAVSDDDARRVYEENPERFRKPEQVRVDYVRVSALPFIPRVRVSDEEIQAYYDEHLTNFIVKAEETAEADAETNLFGQLTRYQPLDEVKQEITNLLLQRKALEEAYESAMNIVLALTPDREGQAATFEEVAATHERKIESLPPFSLGDDLPGIENAREFQRTAFELSLGPDAYFSNPVRGSNEVYVIALRERIPSRIPSFEEIRDEALRVARAQAIRKALDEKARRIREEVEQALSQKIDFRDAIAFYGLTAQTTGVFTASAGLESADQELADNLMSTVMLLNQGEISEPRQVEDGLLLVYAKSRLPSETISFESVRPQLTENIRRQIGRHNFDGWQKELLRAAKFEDRRRPVTEDDTEEAGDEEEAG